MPRLSEVGEAGALRIIESVVKPYYGGALPYWDDAAAIRVGGRWLIISIDGTHSEYSLWPWMSLEDLGYRVVIGAATDVIAKGGKPFGVAVSIGAPASATTDELEDLMKGVTMALEALGAELLGGDTNRSPRGWWVDAAALGWGEKLVPADFRPGDLCATSCLGYSALNEAMAQGCEVPEDLLVKAIKPEPPLNFTETAKEATAATDISDGATSLLKQLRRAGLKAELTKEAICEEVATALKQCGKDEAWALNHLGEEYVITYQAPTCTNLIGTLTKTNKPSIKLHNKPITKGWDNFLGRTQWE